MTVNRQSFGRLSIVALAAGALIAVAGVSAGAAPASSSTLTVGEMTIEHQVEPIGVDSASPLLSWQLDSDTPGARQSAYQIRIDSAESSSGAVWDSGRVESERSYDIPVSEDVLKSRTDYTWQVRVWDESGNPSDWSDASTFATAFLPGDDFAGDWIGSPNRRAATDLSGAGWIWGDEGGVTGSAPSGPRYFRKEISLPTGVSIVSAQVQMTADDYFVLYANGVEVLASPTSGEAWRTVRVADLAGQLTDGRNVLAAQVVNGEQGYAGLLGKLRIELSNGDVVEVATDDSWITDDSEAIGWQDPDFVDDEWSDAVVGTLYGGSPWGSNVGGSTAPEALLRRDVPVEKEIVDARAYVTGLGYYKLYINGDRVGDHELDPGFTVYDETVLYSAYDVTELLQSGENAIGVSLGRGYFGQTFPDEWMSSPWWDDTKFLFQLDISYSDGTSDQIVSDRSWMAGDGPTTSESVWMGETYDARLEQPGWNAPAFDDSDWHAAMVVTAPGGELRNQAFPAIKKTEPLEQVAVTSPREGVTVHDFGEPTAGWATVAVSGPAGATVTIRYGEKLREDGTVDNNAGFFDVQTYNYTLRGDDSESYEPSYSYAGFRYVEVSVPDGVELEDVSAVRVHTAVERTGQFSSSSDLFNRYHEAQANTLLNNLHSIPTDTPMYEKRPYPADAFLSADSAIADFDMENFYENWIRSHRDDQTAEGTLGNTVPGTVGAKDMADPLWTASYVLMSWNLYWYYGNTRVLEEN